MSWSLFHTECQALTGMKHVSRVQYSQILSSAYHNCAMRHFDTMTAGGTALTQTAKQPILFNGFLSMCESNLTQHTEINWLKQIGQYVKLYWVGAIITGPTGVVTLTSTGTWSAPVIKQNLDFSIMIYSFIAAARIHLMTMTGQYVSTVLPGVVTPWSGAMLQTIP